MADESEAPPTQDETAPPPTEPETPPTEPTRPEVDSDSLLNYGTPEWLERVTGWLGQIEALRSDFERVAHIKSLPRSRRGAMLRSLLHSTLTGINGDVRLRTEGRTATKIYD